MLKTKKKSVLKMLFGLIMAFSLCVMPVISASGRARSVSARTTADNSSYTIVATLNDGTNTTISDAELLKFFKALTGDSTLTEQNAYSAVETYASTARDASVLRNNNSTDKQDDSDDKDINIIFGGLEWTVTYLSTDRSGNPIATLWLADSSQLDYEDETTHETVHVLQSSWSSGWYNVRSDELHPSNLYGESYIRSKLVGSQYIASYNDQSVEIFNAGDSYNTLALTTGDTGANNQISAFAKFTNEASLGQYIVTPSQVAWQEYEIMTDWLKDAEGHSPEDNNVENVDYNNPPEGYYYVLNPNECYGDITIQQTVDTENCFVTATIDGKPVKIYTNLDTELTGEALENYMRSNNYSYSSKSAYANWADDKLWLPSRAEVGYEFYGWDEEKFQYTDEVLTEYKGIWDLRKAQYVNASGDDSDDASNSWLRSGVSNFANYAYLLSPLGGDYDNDGVGAAYLALRPALHLNLAEISVSAGIIEDSGSEEGGSHSGDAPETGIVLDIILPSTIIGLVALATVMVWKKKEQY